MADFLLWLAALLLAIWGIVEIVRGVAYSAPVRIVIGIILLIVACLVGPGGYSIFR